MKKLNHIKLFEEFNSTYSQEWPMNRQSLGVTSEDIPDLDYYKHENKFQEVQEQMKLILKPILQKKNPNADDNDIEKVSDSFFRLGNNKSNEIKKLVDNCKDTRQCAQDIVNKYLKYVKINFNTKDNINDVEQDSVMSSESYDFTNEKFLKADKPYLVKYRVFKGANSSIRYYIVYSENPHKAEEEFIEKWEYKKKENKSETKMSVISIREKESGIMRHRIKELQNKIITDL